MNVQYLGFGLGLRKEHKQQVIDEKPRSIDWFEIISENYLDLDSSGCKQLEKIRADYPFVMHGVSLSIGSTDPLDMEYLTKLKALEQWLQPELVSDHICWTGFQKFNTHDLLPVPYTEEALQNMVNKVQQVQDFLGRKIALENPSTYLEFSASYIPEWQFINELLEKADCNLLLDVNNLYVNCFNHNYDPYSYINTLDADRVVQIHMAGHENYGTHIIDTHNSPIIPEVLELYQYTLQKIGLRNSMIEWDADIPELPVLIEELDKLKVIAKKTVKDKSIKIAVQSHSSTSKTSDPLLNLYDTMQSSIHHPQNIKSLDWIKTGKKATPIDQIEIYVFGYRKRLMDAIRESYPITEKWLGTKSFNQLVSVMVEHNPSASYDINEYLLQVPSFAKEVVREMEYELMVLESEMLKIDMKRVQEGATLEEVQQLSSEELLTINISLTSSAKLLTFNNNIQEIYKQVKNDELAQVDLCTNQQSFVLLQKDEEGVSNVNITEREFCFLESLQKHDGFISALEYGLEQYQLAMEESMGILGKYIHENIILMKE